MPRTSYQYGTSPRKYEPEYNKKKKTQTTTTKKTETKKVQKNPNDKQRVKKHSEKQKAKKVQEKKNKVAQVVFVLVVFGMLLTLSYREIAIMEMFNQKKNLENNLAVIEKENGQVEKSIKEVESTLDWNSIQQKATDELGMQKKSGTPVDLNKSDNVETKSTLIQKEEESVMERIISFFINKQNN